jgi:hypothetical protein
MFVAVDSAGAACDWLPLRRPDDFLLPAGAEDADAKLFAMTNVSSMTPGLSG